LENELNNEIKENVLSIQQVFIHRDYTKMDEFLSKKSKNKLDKKTIEKFLQTMSNFSIDEY